MVTEARTALGRIEGNELAAHTMAVVDRVRPTAGLILGGIAVVFAVCAGVVLLRSQQRRELEAGWEACLAAINDGEPGRLEEVAGRYRGTPAGVWAELLLADIALADGNRLLVENRAQATARLTTAAALYASVNAQRPPAIAAERGIFGLARARESLGQLEEARRGYAALVAEHPTSPFTPMAEARIVALKNPAVDEWYKWFETPVAASATPPEEPSSDTPPTPAAERDGPSAGPVAEPAGKPAVDQPVDVPAG